MSRKTATLRLYAQRRLVSHGVNKSFVNRVMTTHESSSFEIKDLVLVRVPDTHLMNSKLSPRWNGPYIVTKKIGLETYRFQRNPIDLGVKQIVFPFEMTSHASRLKFYHQRSVLDERSQNCAFLRNSLSVYPQHVLFTFEKQTQSLYAAP